MSDSNTKRILATLDKYLSSEIDLVVYGKSALHLLFEGLSILYLHLFFNTKQPCLIH